jgi:hypothetical protein
MAKKIILKGEASVSSGGCAACGRDDGDSPLGRYLHTFWTDADGAGDVLCPACYKENAPIESCEGYKKLLASVENDEKTPKRSHDYRAKLAWVLERAKHYAEKTGLRAEDVLDSWEKGRSYWYMNYYQDCNQPEIVGERVRVFKTPDDLKKAIGKDGFRCPACEGVSKDPYVCDSGKDIEEGKVCDWKVYGLFTDLGKGVYVFVKSEMRGQRIFRPVAWESSASEAT